MTAGKRIEAHRFSMAGVPRRDRHEAWLHRDWPSLAPVYRTIPTEPFDVVSDRLRLDDLVLHYTTITAQQWIRDAAQLRSFDPDHLTVALTLHGLAHGEMGGEPFRTAAGDIQLADLSRASSHFSTGSRTIHLSIPREAAAQRGLDVAGLHGAVIRSGLSGLLGQHLLAIRETATQMAVEDGKLLGRGVLDLLGLAVAGSRRQPAPIAVGRDGLASAARALIERELGASILSIPRICSTLGISRSTLHRLFEAEGGVQAHIRRRRLESVRRALADPASFEPIHMLAERFGFSDAAHLSRLFRAEYGMTPSDCRAEAREAAARRPISDHAPQA
ncbi:MAG TPA: helix-turn-helix domain-containing protein [Allosphingosinicella sp.]